MGALYVRCAIWVVPAVKKMLLRDDLHSKPPAGAVGEFWHPYRPLNFSFIPYHSLITTRHFADPNMISKSPSKAQEGKASKNALHLLTS